MKTNVAEVDFTRIKSNRLANTRRSTSVGNPFLLNAANDSLIENRRLLEFAYQNWRSLEDFRRRRARSRDYYRGYQWNDRVKDPVTGKFIKEEDYIKSQGRVPLKQNLIRQMVKNLLGQYRSNPTKSIVISRTAEKANETEMMTNALQACQQNNNMSEKNVRSLEEFFLSGAACHKILYSPDRLHDIEDVKIMKVNPNRLFFNATDLENMDHEDIRMIGEFHDLTIENVIASFAFTRSDEQKIRSIYRSITTDNWFANNKGLSSYNQDTIDFLLPKDPSKCRVFEIWEKRSAWRMKVHDYADATYEIHDDLTMSDIDAINQERVARGLELNVDLERIPLIEASEYYDDFYYVKFLTPTGECLYEAETPYKHKEHPYVLGLFPLIDGEVWGLVEDVIDQQRYVNRLITLMDFVISASSKGVLLVPKDVIPEDSSLEEFATEWRSFNGAIAYVPKPHGKVPEQVAVNSVNFGITELLSMQMGLFQDISGVHEAIQGKQPVSGTPATLYAQQAQNATINSLDYVMAFNNFVQRVDWKVVQVIQQFYREERYLAVAGKISNPESRRYDPKRLEDMRFDTVIAQGVDSPVYRSAMDEYLFKFFDKGVIDFEMLLQNCSLPFAGTLLEAVRKRGQEMQQGQAGQISPDLINQLNSSANPQAVAMAQQALGYKQGNVAQMPQGQTMQAAA